MTIETNSPEETFALGQKLGEQAKAGQIYTLNGDLGVGKTVFTQGIARGLGITEAVSSPTFTIVQVYEEGRLPFYHFDVYRIGDIEEMEEIGYGFGKREYERLNCVRAILGETQDKVEEEILELCCNLDDMTSEEIGYATELLIKEGALDVYTSSIQMKKNRPGILLTCMCRAEQKEYFLQLIFKHTSTLGVREYFCRRYGLKRKIDEVQTEYGTVHVKRASGYGAVKEKLEYDDVSKIAEEHSWSVAEARNRIYGKL